MYYLIFCKSFCQYLFDAKEYEFILFKTSDKDFIVNKAKEMNNDIFINITTEHFRVYFSETKKYDKKKTKLVYPSTDFPMFG